MGAPLGSGSSCARGRGGYRSRRTRTRSTDTEHGHGARTRSTEHGARSTDTEHGHGARTRPLIPLALVASGGGPWDNCPRPQATTPPAQRTNLPGLDRSRDRPRSSASTASNAVISGLGDSTYRPWARLRPASMTSPPGLARGIHRAPFTHAYKGGLGAPSAVLPTSLVCLAIGCSMDIGRKPWTSKPRQGKRREVKWIPIGSN